MQKSTLPQGDCQLSTCGGSGGGGSCNIFLEHKQHLVAVEAPREIIVKDLTDSGGCGLGADGFLLDHQLASINFDFGEAAFSPDAGGGQTTPLDGFCRRRLRGKQTCAAHGRPPDACLDHLLRH